jgi:NAD(P)-dependent dehydrogenase (short-subunit alcohol dehydrogenase family)
LLLFVCCRQVVSPGVVRTSFSQMIWEDKTVAESVSRQTMLGRLGEPEDVAGVVAFLLSKDAAYITAECITVAGGMQSRL